MHKDARANVFPAEHHEICKLRNGIRQQLNGERRRGPGTEDGITERLRASLEALGSFHRTSDGASFYFRRADRRLYDLDGRKGRFGVLLTYFTEQSCLDGMIGKACDRIQAHVTQAAPVVCVHGFAYNESASLAEIAVNDFGGGFWIRKREGMWQHCLNGERDLFFWRPAEGVEQWSPKWSGQPERDETRFQDLVRLPHFAEDFLTVEDQRLLLRAILLEPFFPALNATIPIPAFLGLPGHRQHDSGKTTAGKLLGAALAGSRFAPSPIVRQGEKGWETVTLQLQQCPFVLLDNVDVVIPWLNDFLCLYATGNRMTRRKLYTDSNMVSFDHRGRLCITSRAPQFTREDTASRIIPFRLAPIRRDERTPEADLLRPVRENRGKIWGGILARVSRIQDALPRLKAPQPQSRLADFERFGWYVTACDGQEAAWIGAMRRLEGAQANFALADRPLVVALRHLLEDGDISDLPTSHLFEKLKEAGTALGMSAPTNAATCTREINECKEQIEAYLGVTIAIRTSGGQSRISITRMDEKRAA